jgi:hypothetical protein
MSGQGGGRMGRVVVEACTHLHVMAAAHARPLAVLAPEGVEHGLDDPQDRPRDEPERRGAGTDPW